jgi:hypothetical protein
MSATLQAGLFGEYFTPKGEVRLVPCLVMFANAGLDDKSTTACITYTRHIPMLNKHGHDAGISK